MSAFRIAFHLTVVAAFVVAGCATQTINPSGTNTPATQATISADSKAGSFILVPGNFIGVTIQNVDGVKVGAGTSQVSVDPGKHIISVTCRAVGAESSQELSVDAVAGAHYHVVALVGGNQQVPCTSLVEQKSKSGNWEPVRAANSSPQGGGGR
jgi:hypothetical protein